MKPKWALTLALAAMSVAVFPASLRADSLPSPPASADSPGLIVDPAITRADPAITFDPAARVYRLYATETWFAFVPEWQSSTAKGPWTYVGDALPALPAWHGPIFTTWAPEVQQVNGVWTLWASTADSQGNFCPFRATARGPAGPFTVDPRRAPCDSSLNGDIDPSMVLVDGQWWLLDKTNANGVGKPTTFFSQRIGADGMPYGRRYAILTSRRPWESGLIEQPNLIRNPATGQWWLIFSAGNSDPANSTYQIYTTPCDGPEGPCHDEAAINLVRRNAQGAAPGEQFAFTAPGGQVWIAYNPGGFFAEPLDRPLAMVKLDFDDQGEPYVVTP